MTRLPFYQECVGWPDDLMPALRYLVDEGVPIKRDTFMRHVITGEIPPGWYPHKRQWGYSFHRLPGFPIYWYVHSAIEFVFAEPETLAALQQHALLVEAG